MEDNKITMTQTSFNFDKSTETYGDSVNNYKRADDAEAEKYARLTEIAELKKKVEYLEGIINGKKEEQEA